MLLGRADVYAGVQVYPLFTMSRKPPRERMPRAEKLLSCKDAKLVEPAGIEPATSSLQS